MREIDSIKEQTGDISALNPRRRRRGKKRENIQKKKRVRERSNALNILFPGKKKNNEGEKNIGSGILKKGTALEEKQKSSFFLIGRK